MRWYITLVHGTFSHGNSWTTSDSPFHIWLDKELSKDGSDTIIYRFDWSGGNSPRARSLAAENLAEHIKLVGERYPRHEHYLICHSHGGNVALKALSLGTEELIRGVVTLGTPFLSCQRRDFDATLNLAPARHHSFWVSPRSLLPSPYFATSLSCFISLI